MMPGENVTFGVPFEVSNAVSFNNKLTLLFGCIGKRIVAAQNRGIVYVCCVSNSFLFMLSQIDHGYGVERDALLILDIKTKPHKTHIATQAFTLQELLGGE